MTTVTLPSAPPRGQRRQVLVVLSFALLLVSGALLAYGNSFAGPLVLDDMGAIRDNATIEHLWPIGPVLHPPGVGSTVQGRPVLNLTFALNYAVGQVEVRGYHATNLAIHILAGLVLFGLLRRTLRLPVLRSRFGSPLTADLLAFAIALIWLVHPLQTAAVTYLSQRAESLVGLWYLLTMYCAVRGMTAGNCCMGATDKRSPRGRNLSVSGNSLSDTDKAPELALSVAPQIWCWFFLAILFCALGMGTKEVMVSAPLLVLLYDRTLVARSWRQLWQQRWGLYVGLAAIWILLALLVWTARGRGGTAGAAAGVSPWHYLLTQAAAIVHYLRLAFWPAPLVFDYGTSVVTSPAAVWPQLLLVALLLGATIACWFRFRAVALLLTAFFAILAPSSSFVPVATQTMAEHRMYLPLAVLVILVVLGLHAAGTGVYDWWCRRNGQIAFRILQILGCVGVVALLVTAMFLGGATYTRNQDYASALGLWDDTRVKVPHNQRVYNSIGGIYYEANDLERALSYFDQAVAMAPDDPDGYANRGLTFQRWGEHDRAATEFSAALAHNPTLGVADLYCSRGVSLEALARAAWTSGDVVKGTEFLHRALADLDTAVQLQPEFPRALNSRGNCLHVLGQDDRALADYAAAVAIDPGYATPYFNRAKVYWAQKRYDDAWADVRRGRNAGGQPPAGFIELLAKDSGRSQ